MSVALARGITVVGASAGSGKTHRLTQEVLGAIDPTRPGAIPVDALVAVTYTRKAAAELEARIRRALVEAGDYAESARLPLALLGTVHAACLRLVADRAMAAGLSPLIEPLSSDPLRLLREAIEQSLDPELRKAMEERARRLRIRYDDRTRRYDWLYPVGQIMELARNNRIRPDDLPAMGDRSATGLLALLPPPAPSGEPLEAALRAAMNESIRGLSSLARPSKTTGNVLARLRQLAHQTDLVWADWASLAGLHGTKDAEQHLAPLRLAARACDRHPLLHEDLRELTRGAFEAARVGLEAYADWKARRRLVDFADMLEHALSLLERPDVSDELAERLRFTAVDEFQDTSPLQLALFTHLHRVSKRSFWVGDPKQCIFEYAGADPELMEAVVRWVRSSGGTSEQLGRNYRSRPGLVAFASELFARAFERHGVSADQVRVTAHRSDPPELSRLPPLGMWWLCANKQAEDAAALCAGIARLLEDPESTPVVDPRTGAVRAVRPGDVAVLVATNKEAREIATILHRHGVAAAVARAGLMSTPEGTLADGALRLLLDERDRLALALVECVTGWRGLTTDDWLAERITAAAEDSAEVPADSPARRLEPVRQRLAFLSPAEALDEALEALDAETLCARWPNPRQRLANLDALRALAARYEERCHHRRETATLAGLIGAFDESRDEVLVRDEETATDDQHVRSGDDVVTVSTYHRAKGLEWPVVVLASLDRKERRTAFDVTPESDRDTFDPADPLGGRWVRYWPWPFGSSRTPLRDAAAASATGLSVAAREDRERVRLLYVGFTRARDHLVLAARLQRGTPKHAWLDELRSPDGEPLLSLPAASDDPHRPGSLSVASGASVSCRVWSLVPEEPLPPGPAESRWFARPPTLSRRSRYRVWPSQPEGSALALPTYGVAAVVPLDSRLELASGGLDWTAAGTALHAWYAADDPALPPEERRLRASRILAAGGLGSRLTPEDLVRSADALGAAVERRWPGAIGYREIPISAPVGDGPTRARIQGTLDLLLETRDGAVVIDHKIYPATTESECRARAVDLAPQLAAYAVALESLGRGVVGTWLHFPVAGCLVELSTQE